jgi:hypothetical protein
MFFHFQELNLCNLVVVLYNSCGPFLFVLRRIYVLIGTKATVYLYYLCVLLDKCFIILLDILPIFVDHPP